MATELGHDDIANDINQRADTKKSTLQQLWNEQIGLYADRILPERRLSSKRIPESLISLLGDFATEVQIASAVAFLQDPKELWTRFPVPTLPLSDPAFCSDDIYESYWNGRVWPPFNWCYIEGLMRSNQEPVARELMHRTVEMFVTDGEPHCMENFHPFKGPSYSPPHSIFNQSWCGTVVDLLLRRALGLQINAPQQQVSLRPLGLPGMTECKVDGVPCGPEGQTLNASFHFPAQGDPIVEVQSHLHQVDHSKHWFTL